MADPQDATVEIEHCVGCNAHQTCTWHAESKYEEYASKVGESIARNISSALSILVNPQPTLGRQRDVLLLRDPYNDNHYNAVDATGKVACRFRYPRLGAFEVFLRIPSSNRKIASSPQRSAPAYTGGFVASAGQTRGPEADRKVAPAGSKKVETKADDRASASEDRRREVKPPAQSAKTEGPDQQDDLSKERPDETNKHSSSKISKHSSTVSADKPKKKHKDKKEDSSASAKRGPDDATHGSKRSDQTSAQSPDKPKKHKSKQNENEGESRSSLHKSEGVFKGDASPAGYEGNAKKKNTDEATAVDDESAANSDGNKKKKEEKGEADASHEAAAGVRGASSPDSKEKKEKDQTNVASEAGSPGDPDTTAAEGEQKNKKKKDEAKESSEAARVGDHEAGSFEKKKKKKEKHDPKGSSEAGAAGDQDTAHSESKKKEKKEKEDTKGLSETADGRSNDKTNVDGGKKKEKDEAQTSAEADEGGCEKSSSHEAKKKKKKEKAEAGDPSGAADQGPEDAASSEGKKKKKKEKDEAKDSPEAAVAPENDTGAGDGGGDDPARTEGKKKKDKDEANDSRGPADGSEAVNSEGKKKKKKEKDAAASEKQEKSGAPGKEGKSKKEAQSGNKDQPSSADGVPSFSSHPAAPLTRNYELTLPRGTKQTQRLSYQNPNPCGLDLVLVSSDPHLMVPKSAEANTSRGLRFHSHPGRKRIRQRFAFLGHSPDVVQVAEECKRTFYLYLLPKGTQQIIAQMTHFRCTLGLLKGHIVLWEAHAVPYFPSADKNLKIAEMPKSTYYQIHCGRRQWHQRFPQCECVGLVINFKDLAPRIVASSGAKEPTRCIRQIALAFAGNASIGVVVGSTPNMSHVFLG
ncbi:hypothetical protein Esti_001395 [Eimeria stiedai]